MCFSPFAHYFVLIQFCVTKKNIDTIADGNVRGVPLGIADCDHMTDFYYVNESLGFDRLTHFCLLDSFSDDELVCGGNWLGICVFQWYSGCM